MITHLRGLLMEAQPTHVVLDVAGVGYTVVIPLSTYNKLPPKGSEAHLLIYHNFGTRFDPTQRLFGFFTAAEKEMYELLLDVKLGAKTALHVVSGISPETFRSAVASGDAKALASIPGLPKKKAEHIILELREKVGDSFVKPTLGGRSEGGQQLIGDAVSALVSLGYKPIEAHQAIRQAATELGEKATVESLIRIALK